MQNKGNCGCDQGFIPVNGNWDFNMDRSCGCQQGPVRRNNRRSACQACEQEYVREREDSDCKCERCDDDRQAMCCEQNTYIRDMDDCECERRCPRNDDNGRGDCPCQDSPRSRARRCNDCDACGEYQENTTSCRNSCNECAERRYNDCDECDECSRNGRCYNGCDEYEEHSGNGRCYNGCNECRERTEYRESGGNGYNSNPYARQQNNGRPCKNRNVGMVSVEMQEIDDIFESETALRAGTLFPELHKPLNGYCPCDRNCGNCAQAAAFAAWEMRLYLNTHPHDKKALCFFRKLCKEAEEENYATTFLTDECCTSDWSWVENPWPWEYSCRCGDDKPGCGCRNSNG